MTTDTLEIALDEDYPEIRESVRRICEDFPGAYWRKLEDDKAYEAFMREWSARRHTDPRRADAGG
jgi:hypothetical protein